MRTLGVAIFKQPRSKEVPSIRSYHHELYSILLMDLLSFGVRTHEDVAIYRNQVFMHKEDSAEIHWPPDPRTCKEEANKAEHALT